MRSILLKLSFEDAREVNNVRGMLGFTGTLQRPQNFRNGSRYGYPGPASIYTKELITDFGREENYPRGFLWRSSAARKLRDVVIGMGACTDSKVNRIRFKDHDFAAIADFDMVRNGGRRG